MGIDASAFVRRYMHESQRLSLCRGLVSCYVRPELVVEHDLPVSDLNGPGELVALDVAKLKLAHDVSVN